MRLRHWLLSLAAAWAGGAAAHAGLAASVPADGAALAAAPSSIELRFTEPVTPVVIRLISASRPPLVFTAPQAPNEVVNLTVPGTLGRGIYTVSFRVISADSHPIGGSIVFGIGEPAPMHAAGGDGDRPSPWTTLVRAIRDLSLLIAAGAALFLLGIARFPAERTLLLVSSGVAIMAAVAGVGVQGAEMADRAFWSADAWRTGLSSSVGLSAGIAASAALLIAVAATRPAGGARTVLLLAGALGIVASLPLTGHATTARPGGVAVAALAAHGLAAAFWIGSLAALFAIMSSRVSAGMAAAVVLQRFSRWAMIAVTVLVAAGIVFAVLQLGSFAELVESRYGRLVLGKIGLLLLVLGLAVFNRFRWLPMLSRGAAASASRLRWSIAGEGALVACIIGVTAVLVQTPPPRAAAAQPAFTQKLAYQSDFAELSVSPARAGTNTIVVRFHDKDGVPFDPEEVLVETANEAAGVEPALRPIRRVGPGHYVREGSELAFPGVWTIQLHARLGAGEVAIFRCEVHIF
jgi:copper transport protein